ncbi:uncharacterized protein DNG_00135 [Cephalotrichum gorgonifer]|uniref:Integral membrane protein n=1 Tax=Cephalotrichum gorgonifer TaxID=2041049 RepID=A0AAE8MQ94_9PEZI|nr:uncharacterized protein DNG_00135 [Cephalotrichum gorgonifer]
MAGKKRIAHSTRRTCSETLTLITATTIVPFSALPSCAADCGPLFDANGACVPPVLPESDEATYEACFCNQGSVAGFKTGTAGVCDSVCTGTDALKSLVEIQNWFADMCNVAKVTDTSGESGASDSSDSTSGNSGSGSGSSTRKVVEGQSWVQMHWRWLVAIIVIILLIIIIWVGAFYWRRRHLRNKELRLRGMGQNPDAHSSWGPGAAPPEASQIASGVFTSPGSNSSDEPAKSRWFRPGKA